MKTHNRTSTNKNEKITDNSQKQTQTNDRQLTTKIENTQKQKTENQ